MGITVICVKVVLAARKSWTSSLLLFCRSRYLCCRLFRLGVNLGLTHREASCCCSFDQRCWWWWFCLTSLMLKRNCSSSFRYCAHLYLSLTPAGYPTSMQKCWLPKNVSWVSMSFLMSRWKPEFVFLFWSMLCCILYCDGMMFIYYSLYDDQKAIVHQESGKHLCLYAATLCWSLSCLLTSSPLSLLIPRYHDLFLVFALCISIRYCWCFR